MKEKVLLLTIYIIGTILSIAIYIIDKKGDNTKSYYHDGFMTGMWIALFLFEIQKLMVS